MGESFTYTWGSVAVFRDRHKQIKNNDRWRRLPLCPLCGVKKAAEKKDV